jgi:uncharacterized protein (DUF433 family)
MAIETLNNHIEATAGTAGGKPRITGRRITVQDIAIWHERLGMNADEIASEYSLNLSEIYAALTYYYDHREQIDFSIREGNAFAEALKANLPSRLKQKLNME